MLCPQAPPCPRCTQVAPPEAQILGRAIEDHEASFALWTLAWLRPTSLALEACSLALGTGQGLLMPEERFA